MPHPITSLTDTAALPEVCSTDLAPSKKTKSEIFFLECMS